MNIIDIHVHPPDPGLTQAQFLKTVKRMLDAGRAAGITRQVFMAWIDQESNKQVHDLVNLYPDDIIGFVRGWCSDPASPQTVEKYISNYGFKGIKLHNENRWPLNGILGCHAIFTKAEELDVPVLIHSFHEEEGLTADQHRSLAGGTAHFPVQTMAELGKRFPGVTFIFAHLGMMWVKALHAARPFTNLYFDVSGFDPERGIVEDAVTIIGAERLLFGSDAPGRAYAAQVAKVMYADIPDRDKALILYQNASRLLRLNCDGASLL